MFHLKPMTLADRAEYANVLRDSFNAWYAAHGWNGDYFKCGPEEAAIFFDIYEDLDPGLNVAAFDDQSGKMMGACFYHPRDHHVSLGVMSVGPDYFGRGVGKALVKHIHKYTDDNGYRALRLVGSAMNVDSFSLYNSNGFVPRESYNDMVLSVTGARYPAEGEDRVRPATLDDVKSIGDLEMEISGIRRDGDYEYCIRNPRNCLFASVLESASGELDGFMASLRHPALNQIGPAFARNEEDMLAMLAREVEHFRGSWVLMVIPMRSRRIVEQLYIWGARNVETHLFQVRGEFKPFAGVNIPSFLPETG